MLDDWQGHAEEVGLLEGALADELLVDLSGDGDKRDAVHVGVGDAGDQVGGSGARGRHAYPGLSGGAGIAVGHESTALLLTGEDGTNRLRAGERLVQFHGCAARVGEHHVHALALKSLDEYVGSVHGGPALAFCLGIGLIDGFGIHDFGKLNHTGCQKTC